jgi:hypothetical protein
VIRQCDFCGEGYRAVRSSSRFCSPRCRSRNDGAPRSATPPAADAKPGADDSVASLVEAVERELTALGVLDSAAGRAALMMAGLMADPGESASGRAAAGRQFASFMRQARSAGPVGGDELDELKARVARKSLEVIIVNRDGGEAASDE